MLRRGFLGWFLVFVSLANVCFAEDRHPFVSGSFYPSDKFELNKQVSDFLEKAELPKDPNGEIVAMVVPHAGYIYSGQTAAYAYKLLEQHPVDTVVLIGPYHKAAFRGASVWQSGVWQTPLGDVTVDAELAQKIVSESQDFDFLQEAHAAEHSLETQLPFLQKTLKDFKIVPILITDPSGENVKALAGALYKHLTGRNAVVIASSDMSHYFEDTKARTMDARMLDLMIKQDEKAIFAAVRDGEGELCGEAAVLVALEYAKLRGRSTLELLRYSNSSNATGDKSRVVGYGASVIWAGDRAQKDVENPSSLTAEQKTNLLKLARDTVESSLTGSALPVFDSSDPFYKENKAVFVTLKKGNDLRGCIGRIMAEEPLVDAVRHMALEAASKDPRFKPVTPDELKDIHYEISVLGAPQAVASVDEIILGKHGVILTRGDHSGVFLPKVAEMFDWDKTHFLNELCTQKAHLPEDCFKDPDTRLATFTAEEFADNP